MLLTNEFCMDCKKVTNHYDGNCAICSDKKEKKRIATWNKKTTEQKLDDLRKRIEDLERGPTVFG